MEREAGLYKEEKEKKRIVKITVGAVLAIVVVFLTTTVGRNLARDQEVSITSLEQLKKIGRAEGYPIDGSYILEKDIDGGGRTIEAVGSKDKPFAGHFDGKGHTIRNLTVRVREEREIRTREVVIEAKSGETVALEERSEPEETQDVGGYRKEDGSQSVKNEQETDTAAGTPKTEKLTVSVDGYPLFEYTTDKNPGQVENLCLDGVTAIETKAAGREGQPAEEKSAVRKPASKNEDNTDKTQKEKTKSPVELHTWEEFKNIGNTSYNSAYTMDADYLLVRDIKSDGEKFTPIGTKEHPFTGTFDGQGKKIDVSANPEIKTDSAYNGLFGTVNSETEEKDVSKGNEE